jgi:hypothetical protein
LSKAELKQNISKFETYIEYEEWEAEFDFLKTINNPELISVIWERLVSYINFSGKAVALTNPNDPPLS